MTVGELRKTLAELPDDMLVAAYDRDDTPDLHPAQCVIENLVAHNSNGEIWLHPPGRKQLPDLKAFVIF